MYKIILKSMSGAISQVSGTGDDSTTPDAAIKNNIPKSLNQTSRVNKFVDSEIL